MSGAQRRDSQVDAIISQVAKEFKVAENVVFSGSQGKIGKIPRAEAWRRLHLMGYSYGTIGEIFGCHHTTVGLGINGDKKEPKSTTNEIPCPDNSGEWAI